MEYKKLAPEIFNAEADNVAKLADIFPAAVKDGVVDFAALREELGQFEEVGAEKYELTWAGKQAAKKLSQTDVVGRTLKFVPEDSKDADTTQNLYIEGDNLEVLKLLRQNYYGAIKMIYIDPPYNTGNDFVYRDNFKQSQAESDESEGETVDGERMVVNQKSGNRFHANWLNMLYPRLRIAKDLLSDDGVIFISIDDNEVENLKKVCNEIYGEQNFLAQLIWERAYAPKNDAKFVSNSHDYVIMYAKFIDSFTIGRLERTEEANARYQNLDNDPRGEWKPSDMSVKSYTATNDYPITTPSGRLIEPPAGRCWSLSKNAFLERLQDNRIYFGADGNSVPCIKRFLTELKYDGMAPQSIMFYKDVGHSQEGAKEVTMLLDAGAFDGPKPVRLMLRLLTLANLDNDSIIFDFFSGSASMAHAVMKYNADKEIDCSFILTQYPELCGESGTATKAGYLNICEIGKERIRRAGEKIKADSPLTAQNLDIGFRVFRVADTNIRWTHEAIKGQLELDENMLSQKDRLDFIPGYTDIDVVYEILLRQRDIPLSAKVEKLGIGKRTYMFADAYVVCLDDSMSVELVEALAAVEPTPIKYVFRDSAFDDNISLKDETIRRLEAYIARNSGDQKKTYTVEFL